MDNEKNNRPLYVLMLMGCILVLILSIGVEKGNSINVSGKVEKAKNIIILMPDTQAFSEVIEARILLNGINGDIHYQETLEDIGYKKYKEPRFINSKKRNSTKDSPALLKAKNYNNNNEISNKVDSNTGEWAGLISTILELANAKRKATGIVVTSGIFCASHSTLGEGSGLFDWGTDMARRYIEEAKVDVIFGGGLCNSNLKKVSETGPGSLKLINNPLDIFDLAVSKGYKCITNRAEMEAAAGDGTKRIMGIFGTEQRYQGSGKTPELFRVDGSDYPDGEPTLPEMTVAAMNILEKDGNGFLLMIEGTQIDLKSNENDREYILAESLAFDKAVNEVLGWINESPDRKSNTLVVILADHDCPDLGINASTRSISESGDLYVIHGGRTSRYTWDDNVIFSQGPGNERLYAVLNDTDLYDIMESIPN